MMAQYIVLSTPFSSGGWDGVETKEKFRSSYAHQVHFYHLIMTMHTHFRLVNYDSHSV
jgi:hypothetical protein